MTPRLLAPILAVAALTGALAASAGAANPEPPAATTSAATDVTLNSATLNATVDPQGSATTYRFEYGTSDSYGLATTEKDAGAGNDPVKVVVAITGLTSDTTYHLRIVATNAAGITRSSDRTFKTLPAPRAPAISTSAARSVKAATATLAARLDPRGQKTTYRFEYGTSTRYGATTPDASAEGSGARAVSAPITGLTPYTTYNYRLVATNATGTTRGGNRTFRTLRAPTSITLGVTPNPVSWGDQVTLTGQVLGSGVSGTSVAVQRSDFPFARGFWVPKSFSVKSDGRFTTTVGPLWETTRVQLVTRTTNVATSPIAQIAVRVRVGVRRQSAGRRGVVLSGAVRPAVPQARVSVQRRTLAGVWVRVAGTSVTELPGNRSRYRVLAPRARRKSEVRVVVLPNDGGAHDAGYSRTLTLRRR